VGEATDTTYRFGPFEVNGASFELFKQGKRVKLQEQPLRLLVALLESAGEIVPRAELQKRVWPENTFVDFDSGLRVAVGKLREALGDDAESPRYIETIPKVGYRFLGPTVRSPDVADRLEAALVPVDESPRSRMRMAGLIAAGILLMFIVAIGAWLHFRPSTMVLTARDSVVIADFANSTGDPVFDETLRQGLTVELGQSPFLSIIPEERIQQQLKFMGQPAGTRLTPEFAREICERTGSAALLEGSIASLGSQYVLGLEAKDCKSGQLMAQEQVEAAKKEEVLQALSVIARRIRLRVGESLATVEEHDTPLPEATTSSLEALKAYSTGLKVSSSKGDAAALPLFKLATEIEPHFAMAFAQLGLVYGAVGESDLSAQNTSKAYELRNRASDAEKFFITASYEARVTGNLKKAQETCEAWAQAYPRDTAPHEYLSGFIYPASGKYEKGIEEAQKAIELSPDTAIAYSMLAYNYVSLDRPQEAKDILRRASERKLDTSEIRVQRYLIAFLQGDRAGMAQEAVLAEGKAEAEDWIVYNEASVLAYNGRLREALTKARHAEEMAKQGSHPERAALFEIGSALWQAFYGEGYAARKDANAAMQLSRDREVLYGAALALALSGDSFRARNITDDLDRRFPEDTSVRSSYVPVLRSSLAMNQGQALKALELLQIAVPYELGTHRSSIHGNFGALYPVYMRGQAYLAAHQGEEAAVEFQKILDHRGVVVSDTVGALAHLQLGRAYVMQGNKAKAKTAYESFLALWKDADAEMPVLARAKSEYASLD
jgi:DNA-binding winged helix-turn-helix (wHTH) protein/tetratricopeptide (TPR) repeat protein